MGLFLDGPLPLEDTIVFTQAVPLPSNTQLTQMFPVREYTTDEIDFATITKTNRAAKFRNWDGNYWVAPRDSGKEGRVRMLPLGGQLAVGEYERRQIAMAEYGGTIQSILVKAIYDDLTNLTTYTHNRIELAWGDVLTDGVLTINENGVQQQVDFGIPANQLVTAATLWSDTANSDPLADLIAWTDIYIATNGAPPGQFKTSLTVARQLQTNTKLINAIKGAQTGVTRVTLEEISGLFASNELPPISMDSVYNSFFDVDGVTTRPIPANKFMMLPTDMSTLGFTAWGTPTTVMELNANNVQVATGSGPIGILVREDQPPFQKRTFVDAVALPVIADPRKILTATVG
ncbi:major capsid protein [Nocardia tengchongensis]